MTEWKPLPVNWNCVCEQLREAYRDDMSKLNRKGAPRKKITLKDNLSLGSNTHPSKPDMQEEADSWTHIRVRTSLIKSVKEFIKRNPAFENPTQVVEFAVKKRLDKIWNKLS